MTETVGTTNGASTSERAIDVVRSPEATCRGWSRSSTPSWNGGRPSR